MVGSHSPARCSASLRRASTLYSGRKSGSGHVESHLRSAADWRSAKRSGQKFLLQAAQRDEKWGEVQRGVQPSEEEEEEEGKFELREEEKFIRMRSSSSSLTDPHLCSICGHSSVIFNQLNVDQPVQTARFILRLNPLFLRHSSNFNKDKTASDGRSFTESYVQDEKWRKDALISRFQRESS